MSGTVGRPDMRARQRAAGFLGMVLAIPVACSWTVAFVCLRLLGFGWLEGVSLAFIWVCAGVVTFAIPRCPSIEINIGGFIVPNILALRLYGDQLSHLSISSCVAVHCVLAATVFAACRMTRTDAEGGLELNVLWLCILHAVGVFALSRLLALDVAAMTAVGVSTAILGTSIGVDLLHLRSRRAPSNCASGRILGGLGVFDGISVTAFLSCFLLRSMAFAWMCL